MRRVGMHIVGGAIALALAACSPQSAPSAPAMAEMAADIAAAPPPPPPPPAFGDAGASKAVAGSPGASAAAEIGAPLLAYEHRAALEVPAKAVEPMVKAHEKACRDAGPRVCLVIGASSQSYGEDQVSGQLTMRAEPQWLARFRAGLAGEAKAARGRITEEGVSTEDLTTAIVDTEARLRALETLRGRLEALLRSRPGKLSELLETERELARVQGDLDSARSNLAVMRARVAMSLMTVSYASRPVAVAGGTFDPIVSAGADFFRLLAEGIGALIRAVAILLPWALALAGVAWAVLTVQRGRAKRKHNAPKETSA